MKSQFNKIAAVLLILCFTLPVVCAAADLPSAPGVTDAARYINGLVPSGKPLRASAQPATPPQKADRVFPEKYRSDEQVWAQGIKVKEQLRTGICWAFSMTTAAEYSYAKEVYELTGKTGVTPELSPGHLAQFYHYRVNDPLGNTDGDVNYPVTDNHWSVSGGDPIVGFIHLSTWSGFGAEKNTPFSELNDRVTPDGWAGETETVYDDSYAYNDVLTLNKCFRYEDADAYTLKCLITDYGAVSARVLFENEIFADPYEKSRDGSDKIYYGGKSFYNFYDESQPDHAVTIVGWDDAYPKEYFTHKLYGLDDEDAYALTTPEHDGAWVVQNSWGDYTHDGGFLYMSYDSYDFKLDYAEYYVFDLMPADTYTYNFMYDGSAVEGDSYDPGNEDIRTDAGSCAANVFRNTTGEAIRIDAVSYVSFPAGLTESRLKVFKDIEDPNDPESGVPSCEQAFYSDKEGLKTEELLSPVTVEPGETFSVVFYFDTQNPIGVERKMDDLHDVRTYPGQSFIKKAGADTWEDMKDYGACFRIKALANPVNANVYGNSNADGTVSVTVKNAPDNALLIAARKQDGEMTGARVLPVSETFSEEISLPGEGKEITLALLDGESLAPICKAYRIGQ